MDRRTLQGKTKFPSGRRSRLTETSPSLALSLSRSLCCCCCRLFFPVAPAGASLPPQLIADALSAPSKDRLTTSTLSTYGDPVGIPQYCLPPLVDCSLCSETVEHNFLDLRKGYQCPQRIVTCEYCAFPLPAIDLSKHQEVCGTRTWYCNICKKYVRLRERAVHDVQFHQSSNNVGESSRNGSISGEDNVHRRRPEGEQHDLSTKRLWFTIAITGIAILIGSIFFKRKPDDHR